MLKTIYFITDRNLTLSDSVSRYIIDLSEALAKGGFNVTIFSSSEAKRSDYVLPQNVNFSNEMPDPADRAIFHFHLTYTIRAHTQFLFDNVSQLKNKSIVTLHVTPEYAIQMVQQASMIKILSFISEQSLLVQVFSNYSKYDLKKYGLNRVAVVYPGLNLSRYQEYLPFTKQKKRQILVVASNPDALFVRNIKGFNFIETIKKTYPDIKVKEVINLSFSEYLKAMAESEFYIALSKLEHYGLAIIDAYNLFTIPIYSNEGGLTEAIYGNGIPIYTEGTKVFLPKKLPYTEIDARYNYLFSQTEHTIEKHMKNMLSVYELIKP